MVSFLSCYQMGVIKFIEALIFNQFICIVLNYIFIILWSGLLTKARGYDLENIQQSKNANLLEFRINVSLCVSVHSPIYSNFQFLFFEDFHFQIPGFETFERDKEFLFKELSRYSLRERALVEIGSLQKRFSLYCFTFTLSLLFLHCCCFFNIHILFRHR